MRSSGGILSVKPNLNNSEIGSLLRVVNRNQKHFCSLENVDWTCDECSHDCLYVCMCLSANISQKPDVKTLPNVRCMLPVPWPGSPLVALRFFLDTSGE